jgi:hypothetical protein
MKLLDGHKVGLKVVRVDGGRNANCVGGGGVRVFRKSVSADIARRQYLHAVFCMQVLPPAKHIAKEKKPHGPKPKKQEQQIWRDIKKCSRRRRTHRQPRAA